MPAKTEWSFIKIGKILLCIVKKGGIVLLLIGNGLLITRDPVRPVLYNGCVAARESRIAEIGTTGELRKKYPEAKYVDAKGGLIMPGLINTHMHFYSSFARGMNLKADSPRQFNEILEKLWWRLDKTLTLDDVYFSAAVALLDCIKNGATTIFDHHASPGCIAGSLFRISEAAQKMGIRTCLCYEVSDRDGKDVAQQGIDENAEYIKSCAKAADPMRQALFGLHASFTLNDELLARCASTAAELDSGCHIHTAEAISDAQDCRQKHGKSVVERLQDFGVLGEKTIASHCVHVDEREMNLLCSSRSFVVHNPESNMGNAVGCSPVLEMMAKGVRVGLGTDGYTCDMLESLKVANLLHKHQRQDAGVAWGEPHMMLFEQNADFASACFGETLGRLVPGALADVIVVDYDPPTPLTAENINGHLLFGISGRSVVTTVVHGRILMLDRKILAADEHEVMARAREKAQALWHRF